MAKISNIDAIVELIMREARSRKSPGLVFAIYRVHREVSERINLVMEQHLNEQRIENRKDKEAEWAKGM